MVETYLLCQVKSFVFSPIDITQWGRTYVIENSEKDYRILPKGPFKLHFTVFHIYLWSFCEVVDTQRPPLCISYLFMEFL